MATYIYPIGLTIVYNGNHSTLSGILKGEGTIQANQTYDLVPTYDYMYFDGIYFKNKMNDGTVEEFDGVSLIVWAEEQKIKSLKEFGCNLNRYDPYEHGETPEFRDEKISWF